MTLVFPGLKIKNCYTIYLSLPVTESKAEIKNNGSYASAPHMYLYGVARVIVDNSLSKLCDSLPCHLMEHSAPVHFATVYFIYAFAKFLKATISFLIYVCPSICLSVCLVA